MEKGYRTGLFLTENKENGSSVHGIVLNNPDVNDSNYLERVLLCTPADFMFSYRTGLNFMYTIDITETSLGKLYMETYSVYREYTQNLLKAQEILRDTGNVVRAINTLLPEHSESVQYTDNENGSVTVWMDSTVNNAVKSRLNNSEDCKHHLMFLNLHPNGTWTEIKTPKDYLDDIADDDSSSLELVNMLYSMIESTMGNNLKDFKEFMRHMEMGVCLPETNVDKENGPITQVKDNMADLLLDDTYRVRVHYRMNGSGKAFKREPRAVIYWNSSSLRLKNI